MSASGVSGGYRRLETLPSASYLERSRAEMTANGAKVEVLFVSKSAPASLLATIDAVVANATRIRHPGLASVLDVGRDEKGRAWLVVEPIVGETLGARLARTPRLTVLDVVRALLVVLDGLAIAHAANVAHGAISLDSIILVDAARAKLAALGHGLAIAETPDAATPREDAIAMAKILHASITGHAIEPGRPARVRGVRADVPPALADLIDGVFDEGGAANANDLRRALTTAMTRSPVIARLETRTPGSIARRSSRPAPPRRVVPRVAVPAAPLPSVAGAEAPVPSVAVPAAPVASAKPPSIPPPLPSRRAKAAADALPPPPPPSRAKPPTGVPSAPSSVPKTVPDAPVADTTLAASAPSESDAREEPPGPIASAPEIAPPASAPLATPTEIEAKPPIALPVPTTSEAPPRSPQRLPLLMGTAILVGLGGLLVLSTREEPPVAPPSGVDATKEPIRAAPRAEPARPVPVAPSAVAPSATSAANEVTDAGVADAGARTAEAPAAPATTPAVRRAAPRTTNARTTTTTMRAATTTTPREPARTPAPAMSSSSRPIERDPGF